jgi:hypothetical protein
MENRNALVRSVYGIRPSRLFQAIVISSAAPPSYFRREHRDEAITARDDFVVSLGVTGLDVKLLRQRLYNGAVVLYLKPLTTLLRRKLHETIL